MISVDRTQRKFGPIWLSPGITPLNLGDQKYLAVLNNEGLLLATESDGDEGDFVQWETSFETNGTSPLRITTPGQEDRVFVSTGYQRGCMLLKWKTDQFDVVYENKDMSNHMNNSVHWNGYLYGFDGNAHRGRTTRFVCMNAETGEEQWSRIGLGCGALLVADGKLLILGENGDLVVAHASSDSYQEISRLQEVVPYRCWTVPVLSGGRVYCRNDVGDLSCVDLRQQE